VQHASSKDGPKISRQDTETLVRQSYARESCAAARGRRFYMEGPCEDRSFPARLRWIQHPAQGDTVSLRNVDAGLLYQSCRQRSGRRSKDNPGAGEDRIAQALR